MHTVSFRDQKVVSLAGDGLRELVLPAEGARVPEHDFAWGRADELLTPAYWAAQAWMWELDEPDHYRLGGCLREEVLACLLGGYGIPAEVGLAAYGRLRARLADDDRSLDDEDGVRDLLSAPLEVGNRLVRYRFANQKARYVSGAMALMRTIDERLPDRQLRDALTAIPGVGPKTASWAIRNWRGSDEVSILDVHILRAGRRLGIFAPGQVVERHYAQLETAFLRLARSIGARPSILDSVMWMTMRALPSDVIAGTRETSGSIDARLDRRRDQRQLTLV